mgnify:CR=1 FL=1
MLYCFSRQMGEAMNNIRALEEEMTAKENEIHKHYKEERDKFKAKVRARKEKKLSQLKNEYKIKIEAAKKETQKNMVKVPHKKSGRTFWHVMTEDECKNIPNIPKDDFDVEAGYGLTVPKDTKTYEEDSKQAQELAEKLK